MPTPFGARADSAFVPKRKSRMHRERGFPLRICYLLAKVLDRARRNEIRTPQTSSPSYEFLVEIMHGLLPERRKIVGRIFLREQ